VLFSYRRTAAAATLVAVLCAGAGCRRAAPEATAAVPVVAVLPFRTPFGDADAAELGTGLAAATIERIADVPGVRVIGRASVARFGPLSSPPREVARELGASAVLAASLRPAGSDLRVSARLFDGQDGRALSAAPFEKTYPDARAIADDLAREVARTLRPSAPSVEPAARGASSAAAYEAWLRGRHEAAIEADPAWAAPRACLAEELAWRALDTGSASDVERALSLAQQARDADPGSAAARRALGMALAFCKRDFARAEEELRAALRRAPGLALNHAALAAAVLLPTGRLDEALAEQREAAVLDPLSATTLAGLGRLADVTGHETEAVDVLQSALALDADPRLRVALARVHLAHGRRDAAQALLREADALEPRPASALAKAEAALVDGRNADAIAALSRAVTAGEPAILYLAVDPVYAPLRSDPRFQALVEKLGLQTRR
jgi:TolB-like protein